MAMAIVAVAVGAFAVLYFGQNVMANLSMQIGAGALVSTLITAVAIGAAAYLVGQVI